MNEATRSISSSSKEPSQSRLQWTWLPLARRRESSTAAAASRRPAARPSRVGSTVIRFSEMALIASAVLFSKLFVTVSIPAEAISIATRQHLHDAAVAKLDRIGRRHSPDAVELPVGAEDAIGDGVLEGQHTELEHVAPGMPLRPGVEEEAARAPGRELGFGRRIDRRDRVFEGDRGRIAGLRARGEHAEAPKAEVIAKEARREEREVGELVALAGERRPRAHLEREGLLPLDQVAEPPASERSNRGAGQMDGPPGRRDEPIRRAHLERSALASERDFQAVEDPTEA